MERITYSYLGGLKLKKLCAGGKVFILFSTLGVLPLFSLSGFHLRFGGA